MNLNDLFDKGAKGDSGSGSPKKKEWKNFGKKQAKRSLVKEIEESIVAYNKKIEDEAGPYPTLFRSSGVGGCNRQLIYERLGVEGDRPNFQSYAIMNTGTALHEMIQNWLGEKLETLEERVYFHPTLLSGSYDGVFKEGFFFDGEKDGLEIKTCGVSHFERMIVNPGNWYISKKYAIQAQSYMAALGTKRQRFIYFNRNITLTDSFLKEHGEGTYHPFLLELVYERDEKIIQEIHERITNNKILIDKYFAEENPDILDYLPEYKVTSNCDYCPYAKSGRCKADHKEQQARNRLENPKPKKVKEKVEKTKKK